MPSTINENNLIAEILKAVPELTSIYTAHLEMQTEILPTILFGAFAKFTVQAFLKSISQPNPLDTDIVKRIFTYIDLTLIADDKFVKDVIITGFLEELIKNNPYYSELKFYLQQYATVYHYLKLVDDFWNANE